MLERPAIVARLLVSTLATGLAVACADVCARTERAYAAALADASACAPDGGLTSERTSLAAGLAWARAGCGSAASRCPEDQRLALERHLGCLERLDPCASDEPDRWQRQVARCPASLPPLTCLDAGSE